LQPNWTSYGKSRILGHIQNSTNLTFFKDFKIGWFATFTLYFVMYDGMELTFNQDNQALYVPRYWRHLLLNSFVVALVKMYHSLK